MTAFPASPNPVKAAPGQTLAPAPGTGAVVVFTNASIPFEGPPILVDVSFFIGPGETRILRHVRA
jgi:hypothetical protein